MISSEEEYEAAMARVNEYMDIGGGLPEAELKEFNQLVSEIQVYEAEHFGG